MFVGFVCAEYFMVYAAKSSVPDAVSRYFSITTLFPTPVSPM